MRMNASVSGFISGAKFSFSSSLSSFSLSSDQDESSLNILRQSFEYLLLPPSYSQPIIPLYPVTANGNRPHVISMLTGNARAELQGESCR